MPGLIIWKDQHINQLKRDIDRMFDRIWGEFGLSATSRSMSEALDIDLSETEKNLILRAEIPGIDPKDLEIIIKEDVLTIKGETKKTVFDEGENYHQRERRYGSFIRKIRLPCRIMMDDVKADYKNGILKITMPKCAPEKAREIKIRLK